MHNWHEEQFTRPSPVRVAPRRFVLATLTTHPIAPPKRSDSKWMMGDASRYFDDPISFLKESVQLAPVMSMRLGYVSFYLVNDPDIAQYVLQKKNANYLKEPHLMSVIEAGGDENLFTTDGEEWLWRRRMMQPAFHRKQIAQLGDAIADETRQMLATWQAGQQVGMVEAMKLLTMYVIGRTMYNVDFKTDINGLHDAYRTMAETIGKRLQRTIPLPYWLPTTENRAYTAALETIRATLTPIIEARRYSTEPQYDLLDMLLAAKLENSNKQFTDTELIAEMSAIVFAGHETTAVTLTWIFALLAKHPEVEAKLLAEFDRVLDGRDPTMADVPNLTYTTQVIDETLRLYPPAFATSRHAAAADQLGDYAIEAKKAVLINIIGMQNNPRYWDAPEQFNPDRFAPEKAKERHKYLFMPFLNGPRKCIGEPLARSEMAIILPMILRRFRLTLPSPQTTLAHDVRFVMEPRGAMTMLLSDR